MKIKEQIKQTRKTIIKLAFLRQNILIYTLKVDAKGNNPNKCNFMKRKLIGLKSRYEILNKFHQIKSSNVQVHKIQPTGFNRI